MTGDQVYNLIKLAIFVGFASLVLFGLYRIATRDNLKRNKDDDDA